MNIKLKEINKNNTLKYLVYRGGEIPDEFENLIDDCIKYIRENYIGKYTYKVFAKEDQSLQLVCIGNNIMNLLKTSTDVILMAVTLGQEIEKYINKSSYTDLTKSVVMDAVASAAIESLANDINEKLAEEYKPRFLTDRFSPGYGDMPISVQRNFLNLLNAKKLIGLGTSSSGIMQPKKSITAIIGISDIEQKHRHRGCENCRLFKECDFVKRGETCGYEFM